MIEAIKNFFSLVVDEYIYLACSIILVLVVTVFLSIVLHSKKKRQRTKLKQQEFKHEAVHSLTPEEIDNISNNSANPEEVKQYLTTEVEDTVEQKTNSKKKTTSKKSTAKKVATDSDEITQTKPKKSSTQPNAKKVETVKEENVSVAPSADKTETKTTAKKSTKSQPKKSATTAIKKTVNKEPKQEIKTTPKKQVKVEKEEEPKATKKLAALKPATTTSKKASTATKSTAKSSAKKVEPIKKQYTGKWKIVQDNDGYYAVLTASNGGTLLQTEKYKSISTLKNGIETIKKNVDGGNFAISIDKYGHYRFKLFNLSNRLICMSEDYSSKAKCESGIESVKRFAKTASIIQEDN